MTTDGADALAARDARRAVTSRTAVLPGAGRSALDALAAARVLVVGAGGLGSPVLTLLAGAGLGRITIVDHDVVDASNLARQTLFSLADVDRPKAEVAAARVRGVDPVVEVVALAEHFRPEHVTGHDVVVDAADSVEVTRAVSDACARAGVPFVWGTVLGYDGQVSVFHDAAPEPVDFHDLHPDALPDEGSCARDGVLPALCGAVGSVMAAQVTALVAGLGEPLLGRVLTVDARRWRWTESPLRRGPGSRRPQASALPEPARVSPAGLAAWLDDPARRVVLVDVRTEEELATGIVPGSVRPTDLDPAAGTAAGDSTLVVVVVCASGGRATAWARAAAAEGRDAVVLDGGITAWRHEGRPTADRSASD
ncbi:HesA/MoeB/ThiF family protein [Curtobacterium sp. MCBA15_012]|uniref:HesA/MoeB/ThiF family protein n=1 Tax=Curtobacterium sp. MCBA15_012 TaxID=1898738 RepID=UPI0008DC6601|nr:HesA/MoeB/ThiF family protein [Curtobacterium sp. MCBA15_012]WIA99434.1 HesA/MoeB/ThiF family protein [Curtobacterium sp. MCBA15_012]